MSSWSPIWKGCKDGHTDTRERDSLLRQARNTPPTVKKPKAAGKFPHLQGAK